MNELGLLILMGCLIGLGLFAIVAGASRRPVRLTDALAGLEGSRPETMVADPVGESFLERLADLLQRRLRWRVSERQQRLLRLADRTVADFFAEKLVWSLAGLLLPGLWVGMQHLLGNQVSPAPIALGIVGAVLGFFVADFRLRREARSLRHSTTDSVHTFFDLVILERLSNASASQAVASAAAVSTAPLFRRITAGLERSRLEQTAPWAELQQIGKEWDVPELGDFADIMKLEEQGAALSDALQARVKELRDATLAKRRAAAQAETEALTFPMIIPALVLGIAFVVPPLLKISGL